MSLGKLNSFMTKLQNFDKNFQSEVHIFMDTFKDDIIDSVEARMLKGFKPDGDQIGDYTSGLHIKNREQANLQKDHIDLNYTGVYYNHFDQTKEGNTYEIVSKDPDTEKLKDISKRYGEVLGYSTEDISFIEKQIIPRALINAINVHLKV